MRRRARSHRLPFFSTYQPRDVCLQSDEVVSQQPVNYVQLRWPWVVSVEANHDPHSLGLEPSEVVNVHRGLEVEEPTGLRARGKGERGRRVDDVGVPRSLEAGHLGLRP